MKKFIIAAHKNATHLFVRTISAKTLTEAIHLFLEQMEESVVIDSVSQSLIKG